MKPKTHSDLLNIVLMFSSPLRSRFAVFGGIGLLALAAVLSPYSQSAQAQPGDVPIPGINVETLSGPPKPPKAGGPEPTWTVEPGFEDGFGGPFWDDWW
ncbi:MAG: hypothetical protein WD136_01645 [Cyanobium sp.]